MVFESNIPSQINQPSESRRLGGSGLGTPGLLLFRIQFLMRLSAVMRQVDYGRISGLLTLSANPDITC
jgi:hypothetical protein